MHARPGGTERAATGASRTGGDSKSRLLDTLRARADVAAAMIPAPAWVGPTVAIALVVIAASMLVMGGVALAVGLGLRSKGRALSAQLTAVTTDARVVLTRLKLEVEGYVDLSGEARVKLKGAMASVEKRLEDLDTLADVLQDEVEETALSAASLLRTVRRSGSVLGAARRAIRRRRPAEREG